MVVEQEDLFKRKYYDGSKVLVSIAYDNQKFRKD